MRAYSTKVGIDKADSISMSLVEGLVKKLTRDYTGQFRPMLAKLEEYVHRYVSPIRRLNKRVECLDRYLKESGYFYMQTNSPGLEQSVFTIMAWYEGDTNDLFGWRFVKVIVGSKKLHIRSSGVILSRHALARYIFRTRCNYWPIAFKEFAQEIGTIELLWTATEQQEISARTETGWVIAERCISERYRDTEELDVPCIIKTWVDVDKLDEDQRNNIVDFRQVVLAHQAKSNKTIVETFALSPQLKTQFYNVYLANGGTLPRDEFLANDPLVLDVACQMHAEDHHDYLM